MKRKTIALLSLCAAAAIASAAGLFACKPKTEKEPYIIDGSLITVNRGCSLVFEAENADTSSYRISGDNPEKTVERADASGGKFLAAASGEPVKDLFESCCFGFTVNLKINAEISMSAAYAQTESNKGKDMDMTGSYNYLIDGNRSVGLTEDEKILPSREDITLWDEIFYDSFTLSKGMHTVHALVPEASGTNNPNVDYIKFYFTEIAESGDAGVSVPANDFHTPVQYSYINGEDCKALPDGVKGVVELSRPNAVTLDYSYLKKSKSYAVEYADNKSFKNSVVVADIRARQYGVYNLMLGQDLYWRAATSKSGLKSAKVNHITVATQGPRNLYIEGLSNVRDVGGYNSSLVDGGKINQGLYYRGAAPVDVDRTTGVLKQTLLTEAGKAEMLRLGIKTEIDMRDTKQCTGPYVDGISYYPQSIPSGTESTRFEKFDGVYRAIFTLIAEADNNPVYLHCTAGADRTGIVSCMLLTVCGASYEDVVRDYLFTNFSVHGARKLDDKNGFNSWWEKLEKLNKGSQAENAKAWLMSKGISEGTVEHIREIFVDGYAATVPYDPAPLPEPVEPKTAVTKIEITAAPVLQIACCEDLRRRNKFN